MARMERLEGIPLSGLPHVVPAPGLGYSQHPYEDGKARQTTNRNEPVKIHVYRARDTIHL